MIKNNPFLTQTDQGKNEFWRYLLVYIASLVMMFGVSTLAVIPAMLLQGLDMTKFSPVVLYLVSVIGFPAALLALALGVIFLHKRPFRSLITPLSRIRWSRIFIAMLVWFVLTAAIELVFFLFNPANYKLTFDLKNFLIFLVLSLLFIPIQASTEELFFRSYIPQTVYRITKNVWLVWLIPSILFGLLHAANTEVAAYGVWLSMPFYFAFGLFTGWITLRSQSLEHAIGIHVINNIYASMIVTFPSSSLVTPAIFTIQEYNPLLSLIGSLCCMGLYLLFFLTLGKSWYAPIPPEPQEASE